MAAAQPRTIRGRAAIYLLAIVFAVFSGFPFLWAALTMVRQDSDLYVTTHNPFVLAEPPTLGHITDLLRNTPYLQFILNDIVIGLATVVITLALSLPAAYALARLSGRWGEKVGIAIFLTYLVPPTLLFLPLSQVVVWLGIADTIWSLIVTYPTFLVPFSTWLLMGYFRTIPREIEECALVDGASRMQTLTRIALPMAIPGIVCVVLFGFTLTWNEFIYALTFVSQSTNKTAIVGVTADLIRGDIYYWGSLMAGAVLASVPVVACYVFFLDYYVSGLTAGAVMG